MTSKKKNYVFWNAITNEFRENLDFSRESVAGFLGKIKSDIGEDVSPKNALYSYVLQFYAYNELMGELRNKTGGVLSEAEIKIFKDYGEFVNDFSQKLIAYIFYSCIAESRYHQGLCNNNELVSMVLDENEEMINKEYAISEMQNEKQQKHFRNYAKVWKIKETPEKFFNYLKKEGSTQEFARNFIKEQGLVEKKDKEITSLISQKYKSLLGQEYKDKLDSFVRFMGEIKEVADTKNLSSEDGRLHSFLYKSNILKESKNVKDMPVGDFFHVMEKFFLRGFEHGYGNKAWSTIASHVKKFVNGEINAEMFLDQALSLEHNGGHMFDKQFIFQEEEAYREELVIPMNYDTAELRVSKLQLVFDLQNSGQLLTFLRSINKMPSKAITTKATVEAGLESWQQEDVSEFIKVLLKYKKDFLQKNKNFLEKTGVLDSQTEGLEFHIFDVVKSFVKSKKSSTRSSGLLSETNVTSQRFYNAIDNLLIDKVVIQQKNKKKPDQVFDVSNVLDKSLDLTRELVGGKANGLHELNKLGFNVPKAMVFSTKTCLSYMEDADYFDKKFDEIKIGFESYLRDKDKTPIMVSVRSGAPVSMPGMMDTILNVGIDDNSYAGLCKKYGKKVTDECAVAFMTSFVKSCFGLETNFPKKIEDATSKFKSILKKNKIKIEQGKLFPLSKEEQIRHSVKAVFDSWGSERARAWRSRNNISNDMGTAATVQKMVLGNKNKNSLTAVVFSRDCITGKKGILGEYLVGHQGEELVSGSISPKSLDELKRSNRKVYQEIEKIAKKLEKEYGAIQDIEITVEDGEVFVLQRRNAVSSRMAQIKLASENGERVSEIALVEDLLNTKKVDAKDKPRFKGLPASPGILTGIVVKNKQDFIRYAGVGKRLIFLTEQALPEHAPLMIKADAFLTKMGGSTSHAAILARSLNKPCIVGAGDLNFKSGEIITIDANVGEIWGGNQPVVDNRKDSIELAARILKENDKQAGLDVRVKELIVKSWVSSLKHVNLSDKAKKFDKFLSQQQIAAAVILKEVNSKRKRVVL